MLGRLLIKTKFYSLFQMVFVQLTNNFSPIKTVDSVVPGYH